jgi:hypothetical protein
VLIITASKGAELRQSDHDRLSQLEPFTRA